jgi:aspartate/tyrosine/aromatic aminotransferase
VSLQTLSGTGALRIGAELLRRRCPSAQVYIPDPTWPVHRRVFEDAHLQVATYPYLEATGRAVNAASIVHAMYEAKEGSIFVLHACAHNPTGADPSRDDWLLIANAICQKKHIAFVDCAYQGFATGDVDADAFAVRLLLERGADMLVAQSFAKNFGLYGERVGALFVPTQTADVAACLRSNLNYIVRPMYSNPPRHGAEIVARILTTPALYAEW